MQAYKLTLSLTLVSLFLTSSLVNATCDPDHTCADCPSSALQSTPGVVSASLDSGVLTIESVDNVYGGQALVIGSDVDSGCTASDTCKQYELDGCTSALQWSWDWASIASTTGCSAMTTDTSTDGIVKYTFPVGVVRQVNEHLMGADYCLEPLSWYSLQVTFPSVVTASTTVHVINTLSGATLLGSLTYNAVTHMVTATLLVVVEQPLQIATDPSCAGTGGSCPVAVTVGTPASPTCSGGSCSYSYALSIAGDFCGLAAQFPSGAFTLGYVISCADSTLDCTTFSGNQNLDFTIPVLYTCDPEVVVGDASLSLATKSIHPTTGVSSAVSWFVQDQPITVTGTVSSLNGVPATSGSLYSVVACAVETAGNTNACVNNKATMTWDTVNEAYTFNSGNPVFNLKEASVYSNLFDLANGVMRVTFAPSAFSLPTDTNVYTVRVVVTVWQLDFSTKDAKASSGDSSAVSHSILVPMKAADTTPATENSSTGSKSSLGGAGLGAIVGTVSGVALVAVVAGVMLRSHKARASAANAVTTSPSPAPHRHTLPEPAAVTHEHAVPVAFIPSGQSMV